MRMEVGIAVGEIQGAGAEEEDVDSVAAEGEVIMGNSLMCSKMETIKMDLFRAVVPKIFLSFFAFTIYIL